MSAGLFEAIGDVKTETRSVLTSQIVDNARLRVKYL